MGNKKEKTPSNALRPLNAIQYYYGAKEGWYAIFLTTLTSSLIYVAVPGFLLQLYKLYLDSIGGDTQMVIIFPLYGIYVALWCSWTIQK